MFIHITDDPMNLVCSHREGSLGRQTRCPEEAVVAEIAKGDWTAVYLRCDAHARTDAPMWYSVPVSKAADLQKRMIAIGIVQWDALQRNDEGNFFSEEERREYSFLHHAMEILKKGLPR